MIALYKSRSLISRAIQLFTWSEYSHASYVRDDGSLEVESWWRGGVQAHGTLGEMHGEAEVDLFRVAVTVEQTRQIEEFLFSQLGRAYDLHGVAHFISRHGPHAGDQERWFCSELVFAAYAAAGIELLSRIPAWKVSPALLGCSPLLSFVGTHQTNGTHYQWPMTASAEGAIYA